ncbi:copper resistance D family protein [Jeotgalibacillus proteolyticus]|uniref:Copper resistance protein D domain-containing protein n=1 Tax=Jeotgalibacillus proteolyticus TaxID=2082395 RepID=A0A2S5G8Z8_9BACL|nr:CopD family protein [Jeotgalibacillus proteolyticus]PPA69415.1 hypothetical protein C4B60_16650 [Jeotgalibacillus proteolyticus]
MEFLIPISEFGTYLCFAILAGYIALQYIPAEYKPQSTVSKRTILLSTLGVFVFSLGPAALAISYFRDTVGFTMAAYSVITDSQIGKVWVVIGFSSVLLWVTCLLNGSKHVQGLLLVIMVLAIGYSGHSASLSFWFGFVAHSGHFSMVILWSGILIHVAWFSRDQTKWKKFLQWFTPFAIGCIIIIVISGLTLMFFVVKPDTYVNSWLLPYGQMLLLKHIGIIPILVFAFINGVLARRAVSSPSFNPRPWVKAETIVILIVFFFTSILGTLPPPHEVDFAADSQGSSSWVEWILGKEILPAANVTLTANTMSILLFVTSLLFLILIILSFKKVKPAVGVFFAGSFIASMYLGLILSLSL